MQIKDIQNLERNFLKNGKNNKYYHHRLFKEIMNIREKVGVAGLQPTIISLDYSKLLN